MTDRPPLPPFTAETAAQKVQAAEDAWNTRDPERVAAAYTPDSVWRNRSEFIAGRAEIVAFLTRKWQRELDYALRKNLWAFEGNRLIVLPHAGYGENAYYDRASKSLQFYYFNGPGTTVYTCLSSDIVNHEFGHAVLDGVRPRRRRERRFRCHS